MSRRRLKVAESGSCWPVNMFLDGPLRAASAAAVDARGLIFCRVMSWQWRRSPASALQLVTLYRLSLSAVSCRASCRRRPAQSRNDAARERESERARDRSTDKTRVISHLREPSGDWSSRRRLFVSCEVSRPTAKLHVIWATYTFTRPLTASSALYGFDSSQLWL